MSYTTPATFADDDVLTAAALNTLSAAVTELQSAGEQPPQVWLQRTATSSSGTEFHVKMRHAHRYLWWRVDFSAAGDGDDLGLSISPETSADQTLFNDGSPGDQSYALVEDLDGMLADGEFYTINLAITVQSGKSGTWMYCEERSTAS